MQIRLANAKELPVLAKLDAQVCATPWSELNYLDSFWDDNHKIIVLLDKKIICGALVYGVVLDEMEILQIFVAHGYQQKGYAQKLLDFLKAKATEQQIVRILLEVLVDNFPAINLYQKNGFKQTGIRKDYYIVENNRYDALLMDLIL